jgi:hypothetical protein
VRDADKRHLHFLWGNGKGEVSGCIACLSDSRFVQHRLRGGRRSSKAGRFARGGGWSCSSGLPAGRCRGYANHHEAHDDTGQAEGDADVFAVGWAARDGAVVQELRDEECGSADDRDDRNDPLHSASKNGRIAQGNKPQWPAPRRPALVLPAHPKWCQAIADWLCVHTGAMTQAQRYESNLNHQNQGRFSNPPRAEGAACLKTGSVTPG